VQKSTSASYPLPVSWLLGSTTCVGEFLYGKSWPEPTQMREINDDNTKAISARMDAKRRDATWYGEVYHRRMCKTSMYITRGDSHIRWL
jgi:hypothetical protein